MSAKKNIKIAVAEESLVVRMGTIAALRRVMDNSVSFTDIARIEDFTTHIVSFSPTVVIMSPRFAEVFRKVDGLYASGTRFALLVSGVMPTSANSDFEAAISIVDSEDQIQQTIERLTATEQSTEESEAESDAQLSEREREVVKGVVNGLANKEIADRLNISVYTVLTHRRNIARKLNIHSSIALTIYAISNKIVSVDEIK